AGAQPQLQQNARPAFYRASDRAEWGSPPARQLAQRIAGQLAPSHSSSRMPVQPFIALQIARNGDPRQRASSP
ncbi:hypothetical protein CKF46_37330, partial [Klebsiella pneumoniae]